METKSKPAEASGKEGDHRKQTATREAMEGKRRVSKHDEVKVLMF